MISGRQNHRRKEGWDAVPERRVRRHNSGKNRFPSKDSSPRPLFANSLTPAHGAPLFETFSLPGENGTFKTKSEETNASRVEIAVMGSEKNFATIRRYSAS